MRACTPEPEALGSCAAGELVELAGEAAALAEVEVRGRGADPDEVDVDVEAVSGADHVAEEPPVAIDVAGDRISDQPDGCSWRKQPLGDGYSAFDNLVLTMADPATVIDAEKRSTLLDQICGAIRVVGPMAGLSVAETDERLAAIRKLSDSTS